VWQYAFEEALMRMRGRRVDVPPEVMTHNLAALLWSGVATAPGRSGDVV